MNARLLAQVLAGEVVSATRVLAPGPGHSAADRSMSVLVTDTVPDGFVVNSFAGDDWRTCRDHVRRILGTGWAPMPAEPKRSHAAPASSTAIAMRLWQDSVAIGGTPAEIYLVGRGLVLQPETLDGHALRFHASCPFKLADRSVLRLPALIAAMVDIESNEFRGVHRTALATDGSRKADVIGLGNPKKMLGRAAGACVKISPDEDVSLGLHIAEGIETTLACLAMRFRPVWAALSANGISSFPVLPGIGALTIFADHDHAGRQGAGSCSDRWLAEGKEVTTVVPEFEGSDFADRWRPC